MERKSKFMTGWGIHIVIIAVSACASLSANGRVEQTDKPDDSYARSQKSVNAIEPPRNMKGTPITLSTQGSVGLFSIFEFLYWQPLEGGTDFALPTTITTQTQMAPPPVPGITSPVGLQFHWEPGFRFGVGYHFPYEGWETSFTAAYLHANASNQYSGILFPTQALQSGIQVAIAPFFYATQSNASAHLNYWVFDYRIGCEQTIQKSLLWVPYCGLRGALIHQTFHTKYSGVQEELLTPASRTYLISMTNNCNNVGIQGGIRGEWSLGAGFRLFGDFATALVYGWFHVTQNQSGQAGFDDVLNYSSNFQRLLPALDMMAGLSWGTFFGNDSVHLEFHAAYQTQYWWNQNQTPRFISGSYTYYVLESDDLGLQGLTLGGSVEF